MVIGPTPPGTGVMAPATADGLVEIDVADQPRLVRVLGVGAGTRLMPTSMTSAPGLIQSPLTMRGRPTAATRMSARRHSAGRSRVFEWAMVTVQLSRSSSAAIGLPTMLERPTTMALRPARSGFWSLSSMRQPAGVHGTRPSAPGRQPSDIDDVEAVDVLVGIDRGQDRGLVDLLRQRQLHQDAVDAVVAVELLDQVEQLGLAGRGRQAVVERGHAGRLRPHATCCAHRPGSPDPRRPARRPGPARGRGAA